MSAFGRSVSSGDALALARSLACALALSLPLGCAEPGICDGASLTRALAEAAPGDVVAIGSCTVEGTLTIPAGVRLEGVDGSRVRAPESGSAIEVIPSQASGSAATTVAGLSIEARGRAGIVARGAGEIAIERVTVLAARGVAVAVEGTSATIRDLVIEGPIDETTARDPAFARVVGGAPAAAACPSGATCECEIGSVEGERACDVDGRWSRLTATYGLHARDATLDIEGLDVRGIALFAVVLRGCETVWTGGSVDETLGVGVEVLGGRAELHEVRVEHTRQGLRGVASYAVVAAEGAVLETTSLTIRDSERYGLLHASSIGRHAGMLAERNADAAVWADQSDELAIRDSTIEGSGFAGLVVVDSHDVTITDVAVTGTREVLRPLGIFGTVEIGDGIHLMGTTERVLLERVAVSANARIGLTIDLGATGSSLPVLVDVQASAEGDAYGAIAGRVDVATGRLVAGAPAGWDTGVARDGAALANDPTLTGPIDAVLDARPPSAAEILMVVAPMY
jgi:hypothetical protein